MKRNNELCEKIQSMLESDNLSEEQKKAFKELLTEYEWATYKEHNDRHEFFRKQVEKMVNDFGFQDEELAKSMANDHPTLQQSFMRMVVRFIEKMADKPYYDDRNKASVELAKKLKPIIEENRGLPCI
jgi:hypothetical protein